MCQNNIDFVPSLLVAKVKVGTWHSNETVMYVVLTFFTSGLGVYFKGLYFIQVVQVFLTENKLLVMEIFYLW